MININQHNYEEFFLLYADGELSAADKHAVERFVQENPDLAAELEILMQLQLPAEELSFADKDILLRSEATGINGQNYEEQFLLYVDDELNPAAREKVETFVLQHPSLQENFMQLKQTRLEAEPIVFAGKESLYRKETGRRPVPYLPWQRIATAAVFTGLAVLVWLMLPQNKTNPTLLAGKTRSVQTGNDNTQTDHTVVAEQDNGITSNGSEKLVAGLMDNNNLPAGSQTTPDAGEPSQQTIDPGNHDYTKSSQTERAVVISSVTRSDFDKVSSTTKSVSGENNTLDYVDETRQNTSGDNSLLVSDPVQPAVYRELDTETADQKKSLLLGSIEINKDKLRGFFRKAGSILRGKSKTDDDKIDTRSLK